MYTRGQVAINQTEIRLKNTNSFDDKNKSCIRDIKSQVTLLDTDRRKQRLAVVKSLSENDNSINRHTVFTETAIDAMDGQDSVK